MPYPKHWYRSEADTLRRLLEDAEPPRTKGYLLLETRVQSVYKFRGVSRFVGLQSPSKSLSLAFCTLHIQKAFSQPQSSLRFAVLPSYSLQPVSTPVHNHVSQNRGVSPPVLFQPYLVVCAYHP